MTTTTPDLELYSRLWQPLWAQNWGGHNENRQAFACENCGNKDSFYVTQSVRRTYNADITHLTRSGIGSVVAYDVIDEDSLDAAQLRCGECDDIMSFDGDIEWG